jgi:hypothetical protein
VTGAAANNDARLLHDVCSNSRILPEQLSISRWARSDQSKRKLHVLRTPHRRQPFQCFLPANTWYAEFLLVSRDTSSRQKRHFARARFAADLSDVDTTFHSHAQNLPLGAILFTTRSPLTLLGRQRSAMSQTCRWSNGWALSLARQTDMKEPV